MEKDHLILMLNKEVTQVLFFPFKGVIIEVRKLIFLDFPLYRPFHLKAF